MPNRPHIIIKADAATSIPAGNIQVVKLSDTHEQVEQIIPEDVLEHLKSPCKIITSVRQFTLTYLSQNGGYAFRDAEIGDLFQECWDKPNYFINVSKMERAQRKKIGRWDEVIVRSINWEVKRRAMPNNNQHNPYGIEVEIIENIETEESFKFKLSPRINFNHYKRRIKKLAVLNEELTNLKVLLGIDDEEEE